MRKLATIQRIHNILPIPGADRIVCAQVLGWNCVVKKDDFKVDDLVVYIEVDSILPFAPWSEFLRDQHRPEKPIRLRTVRMKGQISQGLIISRENMASASNLNVHSMSDWIAEEGDDVTELLGITKYEIPDSFNSQLSGDIAGNFPAIIPKTDEIRIQNIPEFLEEYKDVPFVATEKLDGASTTFYLYEGKFGVCSRNIDLKNVVESNGSVPVFWKMAEKYGIEKCLRAYGKNIAIQGETVGPGIQKNRLKLPEVRTYFFNAYDIDKKEYVPFNQSVDIFTIMDLETVPLVHYKAKIPDTVQGVVQWATRNSTLNPEVMMEGLVFRPAEIELRHLRHGRVSFKAINPEYLLKNGE